MPLPGTGITLREAALLFGEKGTPHPLINLLSELSPLTEDLVWKPTNLDTEYKFRTIEGLPGVSYRSINEGVLPTRGTQKVVTESCSLMESVFEIDKELIDIAPDKAAYRAEQAAAHLESMTLKLSEEIWYGTRTTDPRSIQGLSERYSNLTGPAANYIIDAGGTGNDNASIWLVGHGDRTFHGIYPKNTRAGFEHTPGPKQDLVDPDTGGTYEGYRDRFKWRVGVALPDYRQIGRICNIDVNDLLTFGTSSDTSANLLLLVNRLTNRIHNMRNGRFVLYMNRDVKEAWENQILQKQNLALTIDAATGSITTAYKAIPIKVDDTLLSTEATVA
ncbi:MAG: hypothetical protein LBS45_00175 [Synergistaceae bacterium]|jgi:hypothetical protein|nr:hypothetical protein [Synergistaceae bacterium]